MRTRRAKARIPAACILLAAGLVYAPAHARPQTAANRNFSGALGLNTVPDARLPEAGTIDLSVSRLAPYNHAVAGAQFGESLNLAIRQTTPSTSLLRRGMRLYPGLDVKLKLWEETKYRPAAALGLQSAIGHRRMSGEYIALSKQAGPLDLSAGLGWGRFGSAGHIKNPLAALAPHFDRRRPLDNEDPAGPDDWFTGETAGFFGGISWQTPYAPLKLHADWNADRYTAEKAAGEMTGAPPPWSIGASWTPWPWISASLGLQGMDKIAGRLQIRTNAGKIRPLFKNAPPEFPNAFPSRRTDSAPEEPLLRAQAQGIPLLGTGEDTAWALPLPPGTDAAQTVQDLGRALIPLAAHSPKQSDNLSIVPARFGLLGPKITLARRPVENWYRTRHSSPEELWHTTQCTPFKGAAPMNQTPLAKTWLDLTLDNEFSISEEDHALFYRIVLRPHLIRRLGLLPPAYLGITPRVILADNIDELAEYRILDDKPSRGDLPEFSVRTFALERLYLGWAQTLAPDIHIAAQGGYLEEMYTGFGGELLYRPDGKRWAVGAELYRAAKRMPAAPFNLEITSSDAEKTITGFANAWIDLAPVTAPPLILKLQAGRFLDKDYGAALTLSRTWRGGAELEGFVHISREKDIDLFGSDTQSYAGMRLTLPLARIREGNKYDLPPVSAQIRTTLAPLGREKGQKLDKPADLYEMTTPLTRAALIRNWQDVLVK